MTTFAHVLCPIDFSDRARQALDAVPGLVRPGGRVTLLHVIEAPVPFAGMQAVPGFLEDLDKRSTKLLEAWATDLRSKASVPVTTKLTLGNAGEQILDVIEDDPTIDLVVIASHGRTGVRRALLGSIAEKVVRHARCPVLVVRPRT